MLEELLRDIIQHPIPSAAIIGNLILIESLLSVDNAAVLATMVMDLPQKDRNRALKYGIIGAYVFRGICLLFAALLIKIWWLKPLGGVYLLFLVYDYFKGKASPQEDDDILKKEDYWLYKVIFAVPSDSLQTKGDSISFATPTIEGTILRRNKADTNNNHPWRAFVVDGEAGVDSTTITGWFTTVYEPTYTTGG